MTDEKKPAKPKKPDHSELLSKFEAEIAEHVPRPDQRATVLACLKRCLD